MTQRGVIPRAELNRLRAADRAFAGAAAELHAAVRAAKDAGGSIRTIAAELGRSPQTIQRWLNESA